MSNKIDYARVSTREQNLDAQASELRTAGAARVFIDHGESIRISDRHSGKRAWTTYATMTP